MRETTTLQLLGTPVLRRADGTSIELRQRAFALAALLYLDYGEHARRTVVAERLWESSTLKQANTNLRQTLLHTRSLEAQHGFELFEADVSQISLSRTLTVDLREIQRIHTVVAAVDLDRLVALYRGDLLDGLSDVGAEFSDWLVTERTRLQDQFVTQASDAALRVGGPSAHAALQRLQHLQPYSDSVCRVQMRLYLSEGNETGARNALSAFRNRLREGGVATEPEAETTQLLLRQPVAAKPRLVVEQSSTLAESAQRRAMVPRIVLLPPLQEFQRAGVSRYLAPALVEDVTISLCRLKSLSVIAPHTAWQLDPFRALEEVRAHEIDYAVESRVAPEIASDKLALAVRLVRSAGREIVWADKFTFSVSATSERYWDLVNGVARTLADSIETAELRQERHLRDATAYAHYLTGRFNLRSFDLPMVRRARKSFKAATVIEPDYANVQSALARSYIVEWVLRSGADRSLLDRARLHAERAVALDPTDGTGYRELGRAALFVGDLDESMEHMEVAAALSPNHADILADYADTLVHNSDFISAQQKIDTALRLNPLPPDEYWWTLGGIRFYQCRWDDALSALRNMKNPDPALRLMAAVAALAGYAELARKFSTRALELQPDFTIASWVSKMPLRNRADYAQYIEGLRKAGFK
jgi:DNA-binding SARP family transcriptional activator